MAIIFLLVMDREGYGIRTSGSPQCTDCRSDCNVLDLQLIPGNLFLELGSRAGRVLPRWARPSPNKKRDLIFKLEYVYPF